MDTGRVIAVSIFATFTVFVLLFGASLLLFPLAVSLTYEVMPTFLETVPLQLSNLLFFWPQLLLLPNGVHKGQSYIAHGTLGYVAAAFWFVVAILFAWLTHRLRWRTRIALVFPVVIVVGFAVHASLALFGMSAALEGP
jgi:hypothetical protein